MDNFTDAYREILSEGKLDPKLVDFIKEMPFGVKIINSIDSETAEVTFKGQTYRISEVK